MAKAWAIINNDEIDLATVSPTREGAMIRSLGGLSALRNGATEDEIQTTFKASGASVVEVIVSQSEPRWRISVNV